METLLGDRIKSLRKLRGLSQEQLAEKCGVTTSCVSRWENNHLRPKPMNITMLSEILDTDENSFYATPHTPLPENVLIREVIALLNSLEYDEQEYFLSIIKNFVKMKENRVV